MNNIIKDKLLKLSLFVLLLFIQTNLSASHAVGADLTYKCIDPVNRIYEVSLTFYRDCYGIDASSYVEINYESATCGYSDNIYAYPIPGTGQEVSPVCDIASTTCSGGSNPGIQEYVYTVEITLPANCTDWKFWYRVGNRNAMINTINSPSSEYMYVEAELDNLTYTNNNSPTFTNKPVPFICLGQNFCFNHGARDEDGDSLAYTLISPYSDQGITVDYNFGYSATSPLKVNTPMDFDNQSGSFCVTPAQLEVTVMAVRVDEYRNNKKIGSVIRDMQVIVRPCSNDLPSVNGINGTDIYEDTICAYQPYCFDINTFDSDASQSVTLTWNNGIQDGTFSPGSGQRPVGEFCWTPDADDVQSLPHYFTVTVRDNNCTYNGLQTFAFKIYVKELVLDAGNDVTMNCGSTANLSVDYQGSSSATFTWNNGMTGKNISVDKAGEYIVTVDDNGCAGQDTVNVSYLNAPEISLSDHDSILCNQAKAITATYSPSSMTVDWSTGETGSSINVSDSGWYYGSITHNGCTVTDSTYMTKVPFGWDIKLAYSYGCSGINSYFSNQKSVTSNGTLFDSKWTIEGKEYNQDSVNYVFTTKGTYPVRVDLLSTEGCAYDTTFDVDVLEAPIVKFEKDSGCVGEQLKFDDKSTGSIAINVWKFGDGFGTSNAFSVGHTYSLAGTYPVTLICQGTNGCIDSVSQTVTVNDKPMVNFSPANICQGDSLQLISSLPFNSKYKYNWELADGSKKTGNNSKIKIDVAGSQTVQLMIEDDLGCKDSIIQPFSIFPTPQVQLNGIEVCEGSSIQFNTTASNTKSILWDFGDGTQSPLTSYLKTYSSIGNKIVELTIESNDGCSNSDTATVKVYELPTVEISPVKFCQSSNFQLSNLLDDVTIGNSYKWWTSTDSLIGANAKYTFSNLGLNLVLVEESSPKGCKAYDTTIVTINKSPSIDFIADTLVGCDPTLINITDKTISYNGSISTWDWTVERFGKFSGNNFNTLFNYPGKYDVTLNVIDVNGCSSSLSKSDWIEIHPSPTANFFFSENPIDEQNNTVNFINKSENAITYQWDIGSIRTSTDEHVTSTFENIGTYPIELISTNNLGCSDTIMKNLTVNPVYQFWIPSAFSPNNDSRNDNFVGKGVNYQNVEVWVFNRWGTVAYHYSGNHFNWDGTFMNNGDECQQDVYVYKAIITDWKNKEHELKGTVTLLR